MPEENPLKNVTADQINQRYREGYLFASEKNNLLKQKAELNLMDTVKNDGYLMAVWKKSIENVQQNWDTLGEIAQKKPEGIYSTDIGLDDVRNGGRAAWAMIQLALAPLNALGTVNGTEAERAALAVGASPGLAKTIGVAADVLTGFLPVAGAARTFVKTIHEAGELHKAKALIKLGQDLMKSAATDDPVVAKTIQAAEEASMKLFGKGLKQLPAGSKLVAGTSTIARPLSAAGSASAEQGAAITAEKVIDDAINHGLRTDGIQVPGQPAPVVPQSPLEEFTANLNKYKKEMAGITETKAHSVTLAEAAKLGLNIDDLKALPQFSALKESEMAAYLKALDEPAAMLKEHAKAYLSNDPWHSGPQLGKLFQDFFTYAPKFRSAEVTSGRAVEILKETPPMKPLTDLMNSWDAANMAKMDPEAVWTTLAEDILAMDTNKLKTMQVHGASEVIQGGFQKWWGIAREVYTNLLLARPVTQVRNFLGNSIAAVNSSIERELGGWLSIDDKAGLTRGSGLSQFQGMMASMGDGISAFGKSFSREGAGMGKFDVLPHRIPGVLGRIINTPGDAVGGMDNFFKTILTKGDIYAQSLDMAHHAADAKHLVGDARTAFVADYTVRRFLMPTSSMVENARQFSLYQTFQNDLGTLGKLAQTVAQRGTGNPLVFYFPFMRTPINLMKYAWNRTPGLQLISRSLYDDILAGGTRADTAIGRLTLSNLTGMFWYGLAKEGVLTGGPPVDPALRKSWGKQPYSIMGEGGQYPYSNMEPASTSVSLLADFAQIQNQLDDPSAEQTAMAVILSGVRDVADKTYWRTAGQLVDWVSNVRSGQQPGASFGRVLTSPIESLPGGPLGSFAARAMDPISRETRGFLDRMISKVPGYSPTLPPLRDGYGDPIIPPVAVGNIWTGIANPILSKVYETDRVKLEGQRLQAKLPTFPWAVGGPIRDDFDVKSPMPGDMPPVELTPQERDRWQVIYRNMLRHPDTGIEKQLLDSPEYQNAPLAAQRESYMSFLAKTRSAAEAAFQVDNPEIAKKVFMAQTEKYLPMLQPGEQRQSAEAAIPGQLDMLENMLPEQRDNLLKWGYLGTGQERDQQVLQMNIEGVK